MKKKLIWLLMLGLALFAVVGCDRSAQSDDGWTKIKDAKKVVIGLDDTFVPMGFRQKNNKLAGFDIDLARAVFKRYGIKVDFQPIDWSMKETELKNGSIDLIWNGYSITPARQKKVAFSDSYMANNQILVTKTSANVKQMSDMKGKTLGVQTGSSGAEALDNSPKLLKQYIKDQDPVLYDTFNEAFLDLNAGRIQGIFMDEVYARYYVAHQADPSAYRILTGKFTAEKFAVGLRKSDKTLQKKLNSAFKALEQDGTMAKLKTKWFGNN
ncbi:amino acid ABC transporter substrate-binding protein [Lacticaseibacillus absianus]|uniref:amino acid ABC transporter substrate-binding protein n=1 Tax=Lacticaseibacillus absianus TaxID=2729623 RepID=UPI0015CE26F3|nr:amino acid ABC transporter substrate-binding protein [Lacticaseibacillus absianus]